MKIVPSNIIVTVITGKQWWKDGPTIHPCLSRITGPSIQSRLLWPPCRDMMDTPKANCGSGVNIILKIEDITLTPQGLKRLISHILGEAGLAPRLV